MHFPYAAFLTSWDASVGRCATSASPAVASAVLLAAAGLLFIVFPLVLVLLLELQVIQSCRGDERFRRCGAAQRQPVAGRHIIHLEPLSDLA